MQTSTIESNDIYHIEDELIRGNFREALRLSNQELREWQQQNHQNTNQNDGIDGSILRLDTHVDIFNGNHVTDESLQRRRISVHFGIPDSVDRAASIALQSWYELSKRTQDSEVNSRQRYLQPFLDVYTSTNQKEKPMPLELFVVWLKFCHTFPNVSLTLELAGEVMHRIRRGEIPTQFDAGQSNAKDLISELTLSLFTEWLPKYYCSNLDLLEDYLLRLQSSSVFVKAANLRPNQLPIVSEDTLSTKKAIQMCLQYCNTDDSNYPEWLQESFVKCRKVLQAKLREIFHHHKNRQENEKCDQASSKTDSMCHLSGNCDPSETGSILRWNSSFISLRDVDSWKTLGKVLCHRTRQLLQQHVSTEPRRQAQMFVLLLLIGLGFSWRYRNRSSLDMVKSVFKIFSRKNNRPKIKQ